MNEHKVHTMTKFAGIVSRDRAGRARTVVVPGSNGKQYQVIIRRGAYGMSAECRQDIGLGYRDCPGNLHGHLCYHSRSAVTAALLDRGWKAAWCRSRDAANRASRLHANARLVPVWPFRDHTVDRRWWLVAYQSV